MKLMSSPARSSRILNGLLWAVPSVGLACALSALLDNLVPRPDGWRAGKWTFAVPPQWLYALTASTLGPLIIAILSRRLLGFMTGFSVVLLALLGTGWVKSHWSEERLILSQRASAESGNDGVFIELLSTGGGLQLREVREPAAMYRARSANYDQPHRISAWVIRERPRAFMYFNSKSDGKYPHFYAYTRPPANRWNAWGFDAAYRPSWDWGPRKGGLTYLVAIPYWVACAMCLPLPLLWWRRQYGRRRLAYRMREGLCLGCGYDLRASSDRCPECGRQRDTDAPRLGSPVDLATHPGS
jgi:hypothetical protein